MVMSGSGLEQFLTTHLWPALLVSNAHCISCFLGWRSYPVELHKQAVVGDSA